MPGMGLGPQTIGGFYPYLLGELAVVVAVVIAIMVGRSVWRAAPGMTRERTPEEPAGIPAAGSSRARLVLRRAIGSLWIVDGLLQAQPSMPNGFAANVLTASLHGQPWWMANVLTWEIYLWQAHPIPLAAATVLVQIGIGAMILAGGDGRVGRLGIWVSLGWGMVVWAGGEAMGGLLAPGATEMMGAPGAVLAYLASALLLLAPKEWWGSRRSQRVIRTGVGLLLLLGALIQAVPGEGFWRGPGLAAMFRAMAAVPQPAALASPIRHAAGLAAAWPIPLNLGLVVAMAGLGVGLLLGRASRAWSVAAMVWLAVTWWVGQDFGALGSRTATDPNLAPIVALLLVVAWINPAANSIPHRWRPARRIRGTEGAAVAGLVACVVAGATGLTALATRAATTAALTIGGPLVATGPVPLPSIRLIDQAGRPVELSHWSDREVVLTFLDPVSSGAAPIIAQQLVAVDRGLGRLRHRVEFVAVASNPVYRSLAVVRSFDAEQHLARVANWTFLTGSLAQLERFWSAFHLVMIVPSLGGVEQPQVIYFARPGGVEEWWAEDVAPSDNAAVNRSYITLIERQVRTILR